jgi:hypothetical protein
MTSVGGYARIDLVENVVVRMNARFMASGSRTDCHGHHGYNSTDKILKGRDGFVV